MRCDEQILQRKGLLGTSEYTLSPIVPLGNLRILTVCQGFYDSILSGTISTSTPSKVVDLTGYREFALLGRLEGAPGAVVYLEIGHRKLTVVGETLTLNSGGWLNFAKTYPVYAPDVGIALYNPTSSMQVDFSIYAGL